MRTRVFQMLFAYYMNGGILLKDAMKLMAKSFSDAYKLYILLLFLIGEITDYASKQLHEAEKKASITHKNYNANRRFVQNGFARQLLENRLLMQYLGSYNLNWDLGINAVRSIYWDIVNSDFYQQYMDDVQPSYDKDKALWIQIFGQIVVENDVLKSVLEEMEIKMDSFNLISDLDVITSYVVKTIRFFKKDNGSDQEILRIYDKNEDIEFANKLFLTTVNEKDKYREYIENHLINWDVGRVSFTDKLLMQQALAEIFNFDDIYIEITLDEYIELAKEFSGDKSYIFVNGILNEIVNDLRGQSSLPKLLLMKKK